MELPDLATLATQLFDILPPEIWQGKSADEIEAGVQQIVNLLGQHLLTEFLLPARIREIEQQVEAGQLRCQQCGAHYRVHQPGRRWRPQTIFGARGELQRTQYYCRACERYEAVADRELGFCSRHLTPRLAIATALCGASWSYGVGSAFLEFLLQVKLCAKSVENVTSEAQLRPAALPVEPLTKPPGVAMMDGVLIRGRKKDQWLEMKVGTFYSEVAEVSKGRRAVLDASFVGSACQHREEFEPLVWQ